MSDLSHDARTGTVVANIPTSTPEEVRDVVARAAAAAPAVAAATPAERRHWLVAVADAVQDSSATAELVRVADCETALGEARLTSELDRCADQLRFYGDVGYKAGDSEFHANMGVAKNDFGASATVPAELLAVRSTE